MVGEMMGPTAFEVPFDTIYIIILIVLRYYDTVLLSHWSSLSSPGQVSLLR